GLRRGGPLVPREAPATVQVVLMTDVTTHPAVERAIAAAASPAQEFGNFFLSRFLGLTVTYDDAEQTCTVRLPYAAYLGNPQESVHGGVIATVMDISM